MRNKGGGDRVTETTKYREDFASFHRYAINVLRAEAGLRSQPLLTGPHRARPFDAAAPHGLDDLPGPTAVVIRTELLLDRLEVDTLLSHAKSQQFHSMIVVGMRGSKYDADEIELAFGRLDRRFQVRVLPAGKLEEIARRHPQVVIAYGPDYNSAALRDLVTTYAHMPDNREAHVGTLAMAYRTGNLALFLGAGCSASAKLPAWETLLGRIGNEMMQAVMTGKLSADAEKNLRAFLLDKKILYNPLIRARYFQEAFKGDFVNQVRQAMYQGLPDDPESPLLNELALLCKGEPGAFRVSSVVTYNFDDLLEGALTKQHVPHRSIFTQSDSPAQGELPVLHVHGYLPHREYLSDAHRESLVLGEQAYHLQYSDAYNWANIAQLHLLRDQVCLFVGSSMTDPNQRRLLEIAQAKRTECRHYAIIFNEWDAGIQGGTEQASYAQAFKALDTVALMRLGVQPIWVDDFDQIPLILQAIRLGST